MSQCFRGLRKVFSFILRPLKNVQKFIHLILLCLNLIIQTITLLVMIFHIYAVIGMTIFNTDFNIYYTDHKLYETSKRTSLQRSPTSPRTTTR